MRSDLLVDLGAHEGSASDDAQDEEIPDERPSTHLLQWACHGKGTIVGEKIENANSHDEARTGQPGQRKASDGDATSERWAATLLTDEHEPEGSRNGA